MAKCDVPVVRFKSVLLSPFVFPDVNMAVVCTKYEYLIGKGDHGETTTIALCAQHAPIREMCRVLHESAHSFNGSMALTTNI